MGSYGAADAVAAAPPAKRGRPWHLPQYLARCIAAERGMTDLSRAISTVRDRPSTKYRPLAEKLRNISGSVELDAAAFKHRRVLLLDDIYQSGTTLNYVAKLLYDAGASAVYGLICEKTSRDDDNTHTLHKRQT
jgi:predicted amidophosphoribosyltransferase